VTGASDSVITSATTRYRLAVLLGQPALWAQVCSLAGVMMSAIEKRVANCSGVPNNAPMRSVYLAR
jgi:hypothetical protein